MERDPAAAAIEGFRRATACSDALRDDNWRAVQARLPARVVPIGRSPARVWVMAAVALAAAAAAVWVGQAWWSSASVVAQNGATEQASDAVDPVHAPGRAHEAPASLPVTVVTPAPVAAAPSVDVAPTITRPVPRATPSAEPAPVVAPAIPDADTLALEARAIADARAAIAGGDLDGATAALDRHAQRHPDGVLAEDRWTMRVLVACARGDEAAARSAAGSFARARPGSSVAERLVARPCTDAKNP